MAGQMRDNMLPSGFSSEDVKGKWINSPATKAKLAAAKKSAYGVGSIHKAVSERRQSPIYGAGIYR